jgi:hypothetical protein
MNQDPPVSGKTRRRPALYGFRLNDLIYGKKTRRDFAEKEIGRGAPS